MNCEERIREKILVFCIIYVKAFPLIFINIIIFVIFFLYCFLLMLAIFPFSFLLPPCLPIFFITYNSLYLAFYESQFPPLHFLCHNTFPPPPPPSFNSINALTWMDSNTVRKVSCFNINYVDLSIFAKLREFANKCVFVAISFCSF